MKAPRVLWFAVIALLLVVSACASQEGEKDALSVAVIPKGTTHEFWKSIHAGAVKAQQELAQQGVEVDIIWKGPLKEDDREQQIQVVENFIGRRVDGIVLAPLDAEALVAPTEAAARSNIPVVIIDSDLDTQQRVSYVATDNYQGGFMAGEHMGELLGGEGSVILLRYQTGSASTEAREAGFVDALEQKYPNIELISSDQHAGPTRETAYQASQNLLNRYGRQVNGVFTPNETSTLGMLLALRDIGQAGTTKFIGFDVSTQMVEALRAGEIHGLVLQDPLKMGYEGVMQIVSHVKGEEVPKVMDTGVVMLTPDNVDDPEIQNLVSPPIEEYLGD